MNLPAPAWVLVVDDDAAVRVALQNLLSAAGFRVATLASAVALKEDPRLQLLCCVVLDLKMPGISGLEFQSWMEDAAVPVPIVFLTGHGNVPASVQAMKGGAVDFLEKPVDPPALIEAVSRALARAAESRPRLKRLATYRTRLSGLTERERDVLDGVLNGRLNKQIAYDMEIAERTVKFHRANVMAKMGVESVAELARIMEQLAVSKDSDG
jgi:FixJ family two-component response regulator